MTFFIVFYTDKVFKVFQNLFSIKYLILLLILLGISFVIFFLFFFILEIPVFIPNNT